MALRPVLFAHPSSLEHDTGGHPEQAARIVAVMEALGRRDWIGYERLESPEVERAVLERVHPAAYVEAISRAAASGGGALDADTLISSGSFSAALHGCGGAVALVERLVAGGAGTVGFSAHRPPGHHALPARPMGFCLFNSVAVAAQHAVERLGLERVLILDWDVHHGNGTNDIFSASDSVLFASIHQWPLYPGTGSVRDVGTGLGRGFTVNLPVPAGSGDDAFVELVREVVVPLAESWRPQLVLISAGYDAHRDDPLANCRVTVDGFAAMTGLMRDVAEDVGAPIGCVLEGGYDLRALADSVVATMEVLAGGSEPRIVSGAALGEPGQRLALVTEAQARLAEFWRVFG
jgi:acetoin utilization deacetylase AcuC-like enzyme